MRRHATGVAQGIAAAGVAVLYAATLAGMHLYDLIPAGAGFAVLVGVTVTAVVLSLVHGPWVAVLGLVGGYLTPTWIGVREPSAPGLFSYLILLHAGLVAVGRARSWPFLSVASIAAALLWSAVFVATGGGSAADSGVLTAFVLLVASSAVLLAALAPSLREGPAGRTVALAAPIAAILVLGVRLGDRSFATLEWAYFAVLAAGALALARLRRELDGLAWVALAGTAILLWLWGPSLGGADRTRFAITCAVFGFGFALSGGVFARSGPRPWNDAARSATATFAILWIARLGYDGLHWTLAALLAAALQGAFAVSAFARRDTLAGGARTGPVFVVGAATALGLAAGHELDAWLRAPAFAAITLAVLGVHHRLPHPTTRNAGIAFVVFTTVAALLPRAAPQWSQQPSRFLAGLAVTAALLAAGARRVRGRDDRGLEGTTACCAGLAGLALLGYAIRELFAADPAPRMLEWGVLTVTATVYGLGLRVLARQRSVPGLGPLADGIALTALILGLLAPGLWHNPVLTGGDVGALPVWNEILPVFGGSCAAAASAAWLWRRHGEAGFAVTAGVLAVAHAFLLVSLEVRQAFRGGVLTEGTAGDAEWYAYSVAWIVLSLVLLALDRLARDRLPAIASAVVMAAAVVKVFLFDTGNLTGLYRVASLLGLGFTLLALAYVYQRWVFTDGGAGEGETPG